eukprot:scaffold8602_cov196-Amphora_coffeaeformis.AAC.34
MRACYCCSIKDGSQNHGVLQCLLGESSLQSTAPHVRHPRPTFKFPQLGHHLEPCIRAPSTKERLECRTMES